MEGNYILCIAKTSIILGDSGKREIKQNQYRYEKNNA